MKASHFLVFAVAFAVSCSPVDSEERGEPEVVGSAAVPIRNGTQDGAGNDKKVFYLMTLDDAGTASNVVYPRCLLTAAHNNSLLVFAGVDTHDDGQKAQMVLDKRSFPGWKLFWTDLQILWLGNKKSTAEVPSIEEPADYAPLPLLDSIGLENAQFDVNGEVDVNTPSGGGPKTVSMYGYGFLTSDANGKDTGAGIRRKGTAKATHLYQGANQTNIAKREGAALRVAPAAAPDNANACKGDSGGPVSPGADLTGVYAVISGTYPVNGNCGNSDYTWATALDKTAPPGGTSTWDWVFLTVEMTCAKKLYVSAGCGGEVYGSISPGQKLHVWPELTNGLDDGMEAGCLDLEDPMELVHFGQTVSLTASAHDGYHFKKWSGQYCPCDGSTNPACQAPYAQIGKDTTSASFDTSTCVAEFELNNPMAPPPPFCCSQMGPCELCQSVPSLPSF